MGKLSALKVQKAKGKGLHADGDGLYLQVGPTGAKSWLYRFRLNGARRVMGLGALADVGLALARERAADARKLVRRGIDPITDRNRVASAKAAGVTFKTVADEYLTINEPAWQNPKHRQQWRNTLTTYVHPKIGGKQVSDVDSPAIAAILQPLYLKKRETAKRVRGRIESVLAYAIAKNYRQGPNPALWRGVIENLVNRPPRLPKQHFAALPYTEDLQGSVHLGWSSLLQSTQLPEHAGPYWGGDVRNCSGLQSLEPEPRTRKGLNHADELRQSARTHSSPSYSTAWAERIPPVKTQRFRDF
jgi:hypothetical protein